MRRLICLFIFFAAAALAANTTLYVNTDTGSGTTCSSGSPCASMSVAVGQIPANITTGGSQGIWTINCAGATADTTAVTFTGHTTSTTYYILVTATGSARATGIWDSTRYNFQLDGTGNTRGILISGDVNVYFDGIQMAGSDSSTTTFRVFEVNTSSANVRLSNCLIKKGANSYCRFGVDVSGFSAHLVAWNDVIYGMLASGGEAAIAAGASGTQAVTVYSSTLQAAVNGISVGTVATTLKNVYAKGTTAYSGTALTMTTCASSDTTGSTGLQNIAYSTANFANVTTGSQNLSLPVGSALLAVGTNTSGDAAPLNFTTDITGASQPTNWSVGAFGNANASGARKKVVITR